MLSGNASSSIGNATTTTPEEAGCVTDNRNYTDIYQKDYGGIFITFALNIALTICIFILFSFMRKGIGSYARLGVVVRSGLSTVNQKAHIAANRLSETGYKIRNSRIVTNVSSSALTPHHSNHAPDGKGSKHHGEDKDNRRRRRSASGFSEEDDITGTTQVNVNQIDLEESESSFTSSEDSDYEHGTRFRKLHNHNKEKRGSHERKKKQPVVGVGANDGGGAGGGDRHNNNTLNVPQQQHNFKSYDIILPSPVSDEEPSQLHQSVAAMDSEEDELEHRRMRIAEEDEKYLFSWIKLTLTLSIRDFGHKVNQDTVQYLHFQRHVIGIMLLNTVFCMLVLLPINIIGGSRYNSTKNFGRLTLDNLDSDSNLLLVHSVYAFLICIMVLLTMERFEKKYVRADPSVETTVLVKNFPIQRILQQQQQQNQASGKCSNKIKPHLVLNRLESYFTKVLKILPSNFQIYLVYNVADLEKLVKMYNKYTECLEYVVRKKLKRAKKKQAKQQQRQTNQPAARYSESEVAEEELAVKINKTVIGTIGASASSNSCSSNSNNTIELSTLNMEPVGQFPSSGSGDHRLHAEGDTGADLSDVVVTIHNHQTSNIEQTDVNGNEVSPLSATATVTMATASSGGDDTAHQNYEQTYVVETAHPNGAAGNGADKLNISLNASSKRSSKRYSREGYMNLVPVERAAKRTHGGVSVSRSSRGHSVVLNEDRNVELGGGELSPSEHVGFSPSHYRRRSGSQSGVIGVHGMRRASSYIRDNVSNKHLQLKFNKCCGGFLCCFCNETRDAYEYYTDKRNEVVCDIVKRIEEKPFEQRTLPLFFITLPSKKAADTVCTYQPSDASLFTHQWEVSLAPSVDDIIWENLSLSTINRRVRWCIAQVLFFILFLFISTPSIVIGIITELNKYTKWRDHLERLPLASLFLAPLIFVILAALLPFLIILISDIRGFTTKSRLNFYNYVRVYVFLFFMILFLPSIGLTNLQGLIKEFFRGQLKYNCIYNPDNGAFFVNYVISASMIGLMAELLRIADMLYYLIMLILMKSKAERKFVKKQSILQFPYGYCYAFQLLAACVVLVYSPICPIIAPFGLFYSLMRHYIDRYNLYFSFEPSKLNQQIHKSSTAILLFAGFLSLILLFIYSLIKSNTTAKLNNVNSIFLLILIVFIVCYWIIKKFHQMVRSLSKGFVETSNLIKQASQENIIDVSSVNHNVKQPNTTPRRKAEERNARGGSQSCVVQGRVAAADVGANEEIDLGRSPSSAAMLKYEMTGIDADPDNEEAEQVAKKECAAVDDVGIMIEVDGNKLRMKSGLDNEAEKTHAASSGAAVEDNESTSAAVHFIKNAIAVDCDEYQTNTTVATTKNDDINIRNNAAGGRSEQNYELFNQSDDKSILAAASEGVANRAKVEVSHKKRREEKTKASKQRKKSKVSQTKAVKLSDLTLSPIKDSQKYLPPIYHLLQKERDTCFFQLRDPYKPKTKNWYTEASDIIQHEMVRSRDGLRRVATTDKLSRRKVTTPNPKKSSSGSLMPPPHRHKRSASVGTKLEHHSSRSSSPRSRFYIEKLPNDVTKFSTTTSCSATVATTQKPPASSSAHCSQSDLLNLFQNHLHQTNAPLSSSSSLLRLNGAVQPEGNQFMPPRNATTTTHTTSNGNSILNSTNNHNHSFTCDDPTAVVDVVSPDLVV